MSEDIQKVRGTLKNFKDDRGGANIIPSAVLGIVKDNIDPTRSGRIRVYLKRFASGNEDDIGSWKTVSYLSPFFGSTPNTASSAEAGNYVGNPQSYGFWATPPDLGTEVVCLFLNGVADAGYYIGCVPGQGMTHMVPAIGSSDSIIANTPGEADSYGGATRLPVGEINNANQKQDNNSQLTNQPRPIHSYQAAILNKQGLIRDPDRGTISSTSVRESPSRVFGISTPGRPIYEGGYDDTTIADAVKDPKIPDKNFKVVSRRGGHSIVLDDGDMKGKDQLVRFRTAGGHMIMMNDSIQTLFIIHANGQSYIELGAEGTIDMYATNSVNIRTQGDLNLHADNDVNIHAAKNFNINAENIKMESSKETTNFVGTALKQQIKGDLTVKVGSKMSFTSAGDGSFKSGGIAYINGTKVNLNTGTASLVPADVKQMSLVAHTDTLYDSKKGYAAAPGKLSSITSRAPAHSPWAASGQGVNVKTDISAASNLPAAPSAALSAVNNSAPATPPVAVTPAVSATVPNVNAISGQIDKAATSALVSQLGVSAATGLAKDAVAAGAGVIEVAGDKIAAIGQYAANPSQLVESGILKPGADIIANAGIAGGKSLLESIPTNMFTGLAGVTSVASLIGNPGAQASSMVSLLKQGETALKSTGIITGSESSTQTAGLVLSAATAGIEKTLDFAKSAMSNPAALGGIATNATAALSGLAGGAAGALSGLAGGASAALGTALGGLKLPGNLSAMSGSVAGLISGGNFAANMADKVTGPLSGLPVADQLKGAAAAAFGKITDSFKSLGKIGSPINLTALKAKSNEDQAAEDSAGDKPSPDKLASAAALSQKLTGALGLSLGGSPAALLGSLGDKLKSATTGILDPAALVSATTTALGSALKGFSIDTSGLGNLPGGASAISNIVNLGPVAKSIAGDLTSGLSAGSVGSMLSSAADSAKKLVSGAIDIPGLPSVPGIPNIPGSGELAGAIGKITGSLTGPLGGVTDALAGLKDKLGAGAGGLQALASAGLGAKSMALLSSSINSIGAGGPVDIKLPTIAKDSFDFGPMMAQAKALLGNPKIPALPFGTIPAGAIVLPTSAQILASDALKAALSTQQDLQRGLNQAYLDLKQTNGPDDPASTAAYAVWQDNVKKIETIQQDIAKSTT
jgi:hypothetical protein